MLSEHVLTVALHQGKDRSSSGRPRPERTWSHINGDQLLSLFGMVGGLSDENKKALNKVGDLPNSPHGGINCRLDCSREWRHLCRAEKTH